MQLHVIASSSKGNCYILKSNKGSLLLECGVGIQDIKKALNFDLSSVNGCLVTHEHMDHAKSVPHLIASGIDVFMSGGTAKALNLGDCVGHRVGLVSPDEKPFLVDPFYIQPFYTEHDAAEPLGYLIQEIHTGQKVLFATDTYYIKYAFKNLNYILIECNYVPEILADNVAAGIVHDAVWHRLLTSHFSLPHVKEFISANDMTTVKKIVLLHISEANGDPRQMVDEIHEVSQRETIAAKPGSIINLTLCPF